MKNLNVNNQNGRSMIEMLGVLAIIGVLSVGGIAGYSKAMMKYRINKAIEQITLIAGNVRTFFAPQKNYTDAYCSGSSCDGNGCYGRSVRGFGNNGCPIFRKAKIFPDEMLTLSNDNQKIMAITNPFGYHSSVISRNKSIKNDNRAFSVQYAVADNVEACIELMTHDWSVADVNAIVLHNGNKGVYFKTPIAIDLATEKCSTVIETTSESLVTQGYPSILLYFDIDLSGDWWNPKAESRYDWEN